jgi:hypothetical protein
LLLAIFDYKWIITLSVAIYYFYNAKRHNIINIGFVILLGALLILIRSLSNIQEELYNIMAFLIAVVFFFGTYYRRKKTTYFTFSELILGPVILFNMTSYYRISLFIQQHFLALVNMLLLATLITLLFFFITRLIVANSLKFNLSNVLNKTGYLIGGLPFFVRFSQKVPKMRGEAYYCNKNEEINNTQSIKKQGLETRVTTCKKTNEAENHRKTRSDFYIQEKRDYPQIKVVRTQKMLSYAKRAALDVYLADNQSYKITYIKGQLHDAERDGNPFPQEALFEKLPHHPAIFKLGEKHINRSLTSTLPSQPMEKRHQFLVVTWGILRDIEGNTSNVITKYLQKSFSTNDVIYVSEDLILKYFLTDDDELNKKNKQIVDEKTENHILWVLERADVEARQKLKDEEDLKKKIQERVNKRSLIKTEYHKKQEFQLILAREKKKQERMDKLEEIRKQAKIKQLNNKMESVVDETKKPDSSVRNQPLVSQNNKNNNDEAES